jgi:FKBP-type peptidyl-prolyl cis-trans isomerase FkpA
LYLLKLVKYCGVPNKRVFLCNMTKSTALMVCGLIACCFAACKTDPAYDRNVQLPKDLDIIAKYIQDNNIIATKSADGLYYTIIRPGEGTVQLALQDTVMVHYVARTLKGVMYDSTRTNIDSNATRFVLGSSIEGWQKGIPLIQPGGRIRLIVPSVLAYQNREIDTILVANSNIDFDIMLIKVLKFKNP